MQSRRWLLIALLVAVATHAAYFFSNEELLTDDSYSYLGPARQLAAGNGFLNGNGIPETRRTPGYPLILAPFSRDESTLRGAVVLQHAIAIAVAMGVFVIATRRRNAAAGLVAAAILAVDLPTLHHANGILTESVFTAFVLAEVVLLYRGSRSGSGFLIATAGVVGGLSVLVRPIAIYFFVPAALFLIVFAGGKRVRFAAIYVVAFVAAPTWWAARNYAMSGQFTVSTISAWSLLCDRAAATLAIDDPGDFMRNLPVRRAQLLREIGEPMLVGDPNVVPAAMLHQPADRYRARALEVIGGHPQAYFRVWIRAIGRTLSGGGAKQLHLMTSAGLRTCVLFVAVWNVLVLCAALAGLVRLWMADRRGAVLLALVFAYYLVTISVGEPSARFRVPIQPMLALLASAGLFGVTKSEEIQPAAVAPVA
jgi:hypothetical protein